MDTGYSLQLSPDRIAGIKRRAIERARRECNVETAGGGAMYYHATANGANQDVSRKTTGLKLRPTWQYKLQSLFQFKAGLG